MMRACPDSDPSFDRATRRWAGAMLALWLFALAAAPQLLASAGLNLDLHGHAQQTDHGHPFADARTMWGIPNAMDVLSNLPLVAAGLWGLLLARTRRLPPEVAFACRLFLTGLILSGAGSAVYHWTPDAETLLWDRLGMAVAFAGALGLVVTERARRAVWPSLASVCVVAAVSAALPLWTGNVGPWAVVQYGGVVFIAWAATHPAGPNAIGVRWAALLGWYALAKVLELFDAPVFEATGGVVAGHALKHIAAALAAGPVILALRRQGLRQNAAVSGAERGA